MSVGIMTVGCASSASKAGPHPGCVLSGLLMSQAHAGSSSLPSSWLPWASWCRSVFWQPRAAPALQWVLQRCNPLRCCPSSIAGPQPLLSCPQGSQRLRSCVLHMQAASSSARGAARLHAKVKTVEGWLHARRLPRGIRHEVTSYFSNTWAASTGGQHGAACVPSTGCMPHVSCPWCRPGPFMPVKPCDSP